MHGVGKLPRQQNADTQSNISYSLSLNLGKIKTSIKNLYHPDKRDQDVRMEMLKQCSFENICNTCKTRNDMIYNVLRIFTFYSHCLLS